MSTSPFSAIHKSLIICYYFPNEIKEEEKQTCLIFKNISERKAKANTLQFLASYNSVDVTKVLN
jgi:hypothetical protein